MGFCGKGYHPFSKYMITFQIVRRILDKLNAQCLISGAFGVFRKSVLLQMNGYDTDTVGGGGYGIGPSITGRMVPENWQSDCV